MSDNNEQASMEEATSKRSMAKRAVNLAAKRVRHGVELNMQSTQEMVRDLDIKFLDFLDICETFKELAIDYPSARNVNGLTPEMYEQEVVNLYSQAMDLYRSSSVSASNSSMCSEAAAPPQVRLKKLEVPKFSGARRDWPEFKKLWTDLVVPSIHHEIALATELKAACRGGPAYSEIENISACASEGYKKMWAALCLHYDNIVLAVESALCDLKLLRPVKAQDNQGTVLLISKISCVFNQLEILGQVAMVTAREVAEMVGLFPPVLQREWAEAHLLLGVEDQLRPFAKFHSFLQQKAKVCKYLACVGGSTTASFLCKEGAVVETEDSRPWCPLHHQGGHALEDCPQFRRLPVREMKQVLFENRLCYKCFGGGHISKNCTKSMNPLMRSANSSHVGGDDKVVLYAIYDTPVVSSGQNAIVFCDGGSEMSFISGRAAKALNARTVRPLNISISTLTGSERVHTRLCEIEIKTMSGKRVALTLVELPELSGPVAQLDAGTLCELFPDFDPSVFSRPVGQVDLLLGADYFGLHPKREIATDGANLSLMEGELGVCVQGTHSRLVESTRARSGLTVSFFTQSFFMGEDLGTECLPRCGSCKCGKCPLPGHSFSFREEVELKMIRDGLKYDEERQKWVSSYPWISDPNMLPNNFSAACATLANTERRLRKEPEWARKYSEQIEDMEVRGVARMLSAEEMADWTGPVFYLSHLAVENPKSTSTPVRIVFNSSQLYRGVSLNSFLAKGPDSYKTNLLGILIRYRENHVVIVGDIKKMYNSVLLEPLEQHTHRFLWRNLEARRPDVWCITRVNMGDKPAGAIAVEAKDMTAERFRDIDPKAADSIVGSSYVDDIVDSVPTVEEASSQTSGMDAILEKGGFKVKGWLIGGLPVDSDSCENSESVSVLGVWWHPTRDIIHFKVKLNFSTKCRGVRTGPDVTVDQLGDITTLLTRRRLLEQVMGLFDPLGLLSPFLLKAKVFLRETWVEKLGWDDPISSIMANKWIEFFTNLFTLETLQFPRCLTPTAAVGDPELILLSDGSEVAYGCAAYVRWRLADGQFWCRLVISKCRIAPVNRISIPQMELNGALLSTRIRKVVEKESRFSFSRIWHLIDSKTVLGMLHNLSTRFKVYEGVRVGEIQSATNGDMGCWGWVPGKLNVADWATRCHSPQELGPDSIWYRGPDFLYLPFEEWGVQFAPPSDLGNLPGERKSIQVCQAQVQVFTSSFERCSSLGVIRNAVARVLMCFRKKSFSGGSLVDADSLRDAENILVIEEQSIWTPDEVKSRFRTLHPVWQNGMWVVGTRISHANPLTPDNLPQVLLPYGSPLTKRIMEECHTQGGHRGRDSTLARFRARYWTARGNKLAKVVCDACLQCRLVNGKLLTQVMGQMPSCRLMPSPPFTHTMVDLFGPLSVRGEVQKRVTCKVWGVVLTDLCCRALHIEVSCGYDTQSFLLAFTRFSSIRGWPQVMYSDPGSQLKASSDLISQISKFGTQWELSPANSPWRQGAAEALIKSVKRAIALSVRDKRLSLPELLTSFASIANTLNERPIGYLPSADSDLSILTPNSLLMGRSTAGNPGNYEPVTSVSLFSRLKLVKSVEDLFWKHWIELYVPTLIKQQKWKQVQRDLKVGDVVLVLEASPGGFKDHFRLGRIHEVSPGQDGRVRKVKVASKSYKVGERHYHGSPDTILERSVQRLVLLLPVEE